MTDRRLWDGADDHLLLEDRVAVTFHATELTIARVTGSVEYEVAWRPWCGWSCTCPSGPVCAHVRAVQRVVRRRTAETAGA